VVGVVEDHVHTAAVLEEEVPSLQMVAQEVAD